MRERRPATTENPVREFDDYEHFESAGSVPEGRFVIPYNGAPVDFLYEPVPNAKATVVIFHGSTARDVDLPMFSGERIMKGVNAHRLSISDPSLTLDDSEEMILSWFIGSSTQPRLQFFLEQVIRRIREITGTPRLIFLGGSGGGFASLEMSRRFANSLALVFNPQTNLRNYYPRLRQHYLDVCWDGAKSLDELPGFVTHDLAAVYPTILGNTVAFLQNTRDDHHIEYHQIRFFEKIGASRKCFMFMDAWGDPNGKGHVPPPRELLRELLEELVESRGAWRDALVGFGFTQKTSEATIRAAVKKSNVGLPCEREQDDM